jgi:iron complex outermembrane receptor protein
LGSNIGSLNFDVKWTHLIEWLRTEQDGTQRDFAGTHGNCDVSNCMGTPKNRINLGATWQRDKWRVSTVVNFRDSLDNVLFRGDPAGCASQFADGRPAPDGCKIGWFATVDLTAHWQVTPKTEIFASIQNLFDKVAPLDPLTYGATSYNPLDYYGAVGRFFNAGVRYKF